MGYKYHNSGDKRKARRAKRKQRDEKRLANRKIAKQRVEVLMRQMAEMIADSGYSRLKISVYSGVCTTTVTRIAKRRNPTSAPFYSIVGLCRALGYKIEFKRLSPDEDEFADDRWVRKSDVLKMKDDTEQ